MTVVLDLDNILISRHSFAVGVWALSVKRQDTPLRVTGSRWIIIDPSQVPTYWAF